MTDGDTRPTVVLIHGQPGRGSDWDLVAQRLAPDHDLVAPDRPGYGDSGVPPVSMADNADLLASVIAERARGPVTIVGHSYGGGIAILLAARHPEAVSGMVLVASVGKRDSLSRFDHLLALPGLGEVMAAASLFTLSRALPRLRHLAEQRQSDSWAWLQASLPDEASGRTLWSAQVWRSFVAEQRWLVRELGDVEAAMSEVRAPTVVVAGTWDMVVPPSVAATIATSIKGSELLLVARAGHFVVRQASGVVAEAIRRVERGGAAGVERLEAEEETGS